MIVVCEAISITYRAGVAPLLPRLPAVMSLINPIIAVFNYTLQPVAPFTWFGLPITTLDVVAAFRLCLILRQIKEVLHREHVSRTGHSLVENRSFARSALTTFTVVFGGPYSATCRFNVS